MAAMNTEAMQGAGGSEAGAVGEGGLQAARTRNSGAPAKAVSDAARTAGQRLSTAGLGVQTRNAELKNSQRERALSGLTGLTGAETGASNNALGEVAGNANANTNAANQSWDWSKYLLDPAISAAGAAKY